MGRTPRAGLTLLPNLLLTLGAISFGWGLDDVAELFRNSARFVLVVALFAGYVTGSALGVEFNPLRKGTQKGRWWPIVAGMSVVPLLWAVVSYCDRRSTFVFPDLAVIRWLGVIAYACGEYVRLSALRELGKQYSAFLTIQPDHKLIQSGPYRLIRHPFYFGQLLAVPGGMLAFRSPLGVIIFVASILFVGDRIRREEQVLIGEFGDDYRAYQQRSWRLVPWVY